MYIQADIKPKCFFNVYFAGGRGRSVVRGGVHEDAEGRRGLHHGGGRRQVQSHQLNMAVFSGTLEKVTCTVYTCAVA